jgi:predicted Zn-ribbon and HTH transcriptional regulator
VTTRSERSARVAEHAARIAETAPRNGRRPRLKRGPCELCGAKIPADSRHATHCKACRSKRYRAANIRARRSYWFRENGFRYALPPRPCGCRGTGEVEWAEDAQTHVRTDLTCAEENRALDKALEATL